VDIREGEQGCHLWGPQFSETSRGPSLRLSHLVFALFCLKADEPLWSRKLWSTSYDVQNKAKIWGKGALYQL